MKKFFLRILLVLAVLALLPVCVQAASASVTFTAIDGTAGNSGESYDKLLDNSNETKWCVSSFSGSAHVVFKASKSVKLLHYTLIGAYDTFTDNGRSPKAWTLYGSNNYNESTKVGTWTSLTTVTNGDLPIRDSGTGNAGYFRKAFSVTTSTAYQYYKLEITQVEKGNVMQLGNIEFDYSDPSVPDPDAPRSINLDATVLRPRNKWYAGGNMVYYGHNNQARMYYLPYRVLSVPDTQENASQYLLLDCNTRVPINNNGYNGITLLYKRAFDTDQTKNSGQSVAYTEWSGSDIESYLNGQSIYENDSYFSRFFSNAEKNAIAKTKLKAKDWYSIVELGMKGKDYEAEDYVFLLSMEEMDKLYADAAARVKDKDATYWTRTTCSVNEYVAAMGKVTTNTTPYSAFIIRGPSYEASISPAFNVKLDSILFASEKSLNKANKLSAVDTSTAKEWKLTLINANKSIGITDGKQVTRSGATITVPCTSSSTVSQNDGRYITVLITDKPYNDTGAKVLYYGALENIITTPLTTGECTGTFTLPDELLNKTCNKDFYPYIIYEETFTNQSDEASLPCNIYTGPDYTITLEAHGGTINSGNNTIDYTHGVSNIALPTASEVSFPGFTLVGWYDNPSFTGDPITHITPDMSGYHTFHAKWKGQLPFTPGDTYYFDLSGAGLPGTVNPDLPEDTLHYVPFAYAGTVNAYALTSAASPKESDALPLLRPRNLFVAEHSVTQYVSWNALNDLNLIFGKDYAFQGVNYRMRAPSGGASSNFTQVISQSDYSLTISPAFNEWNAMKQTDGVLKNWQGHPAWAQETYRDFKTDYTGNDRVMRGTMDDISVYKGSDIFCEGYNKETSFRHPTFDNPYYPYSYRPVLEIQNAITLGATSLTPITLNLGACKPEAMTDATIKMLVKTGEAYTAPASEGLVIPTEHSFHWVGSDDKTYLPGASVPASVTELTSVTTPNEYTITLEPNGGTILSGNVTDYSYGSGPTLPTASDVVLPGFTFLGWFDNEGLAGDPVTAISNTTAGNLTFWAKWADATLPTITGLEDAKTYCFSVTFTVDDNVGVASVTVNGTPLTADSQGSYTISAATGTQTVSVSDAAGNKAKVSITVNATHTWQEGVCIHCGEGCQHTGGTATCISKATCTLCGFEYGQLSQTNHTGGTELRNARDATTTEEGYTGDTHCKGCGAMLTAGTPVPRLSEPPKTGDDSQLILWLGILAAATSVLLLIHRRKQTEK